MPNTPIDTTFFNTVESIINAREKAIGGIGYEHSDGSVRDKALMI
jgi:hypothetical protein